MKESLTVTVEVSAGELMDKITILQIKRERIADPKKQSNVQRELETLVAARDASIAASEQLDRLTAQLKSVNERLWDIEDELRRCERTGVFDEHFIALARQVYHTNDHRWRLKQSINELLGSRLREEKSYEPYDEEGC